MFVYRCCYCGPMKCVFSPRIGIISHTSSIIHGRTHLQAHLKMGSSPQWHRPSSSHVSKYQLQCKTRNPMLGNGRWKTAVGPIPCGIRFWRECSEFRFRAHRSDVNLIKDALHSLGALATTGRVHRQLSKGCRKVKSKRQIRLQQVFTTPEDAFMWSSREAFEYPWGTHNGKITIKSMRTREASV